MKRIDLKQRGVGLLIGLVERHHELHRRRDELRLQPQLEGDLARLEGLEADRRIDVLLDDRLRVLGRNLFDLHPAGLRGHEDRTRDRAVQQNAQIQFAGNRQRLFDQQPPHLLALRTGLVGHQLHPENLFRQFAGLRVALGQLHAAAHPAASRVNLRLHHHSGGPCAHQVFGGALCFLARLHHRAARHRHPILRKNGLGLVLVNFHGFSIR